MTETTDTKPVDVPREGEEEKTKITEGNEDKGEQMNAAEKIEEEVKEEGKNENENEGKKEEEDEKEEINEEEKKTEEKKDEKEDEKDEKKEKEEEKEEMNEKKDKKDEKKEEPNETNEKAEEKKEEKKDDKTEETKTEVDKKEEEKEEENPKGTPSNENAPDETLKKDLADDTQALTSSDNTEYKRLSRAERIKRRRARVVVSLNSLDTHPDGATDATGNNTVVINPTNSLGSIKPINPRDSTDFETAELSIMEEIAANMSELQAANDGSQSSSSSSSSSSQSRSSPLANEIKLGGKDGDDDEESDEDNEARYQELLSAAKKEDFRSLRETNCLYRSGYDSEGHSIVVLIGSNLPGKSVSLDHLLLYIIYTLDQIVENDYVVAYFAASQSSTNRPPFAWLRKVYRIFDRKYKKNLKHLYIVQPTTWLKMTLRFLSAFVSKKVWQKVQYLQSFQDIYSYMSPSMLRLPTNFVEKVTTMHPIFGEPLERTVSNPALQHNGIPTIVSDCITYLFDRGLDKVGLLRLSGNRALMNEYRIAYDSGKKVDLAECKDPHTIANLLK